VGWVFPVGAGSLVGLGSYTGASKLRPNLERFLTQLGTAGRTLHGTYFTNRLLRPVKGRIFLVGDAAGQCLPLTAEGIRPAIYFGGVCGRLVRRVLEGALTLDDGLGAYRRAVARYRRAYRLLRIAQWVAAHAPTRLFMAIVDRANRGDLRARWWPRYGLFGRPDPVRALAARA
jgi:digeranylgeranylglycerophospholipid reductase